MKKKKSAPKLAKPISVGDIVSYAGGFYRVTRVTKHTVNLGSIFSRRNRVCEKGVDITQVQENAAEWYERWRQTETYRCM